MIEGRKLKSFIERVENLRKDIKSLNDDVSDLYKEAKGQGFDVPTIKRLVSERAKDPDRAREAEELLDLYRDALIGTDRATRARTSEKSGKGSDTLSPSPATAPVAGVSKGVATNPAGTSSHSGETEGGDNPQGSQSPPSFSESPRAVSLGGATEGEVALASPSTLSNDLIPEGLRREPNAPQWKA